MFHSIRLGDEMHLLSKKMTILFGVWGSLISIYLIYDIIHGVIVKSVIEIVIAFILCVAYAQAWMQYGKAFKRRMYDRSYAEAKNNFYGLLHSTLPSIGGIYMENQDLQVHVSRHSSRLTGDCFAILVLGGRDFSYDEDTMTHTVIAPSHFYYVSKRVLLVHKSFDAAVMRVTRGFESSELSIVLDSSIAVSARDTRKAMRNTPADLRYASIDEMNELSQLLVAEQKGTVS